MEAPCDDQPASTGQRRAPRVEAETLGQGLGQAGGTREERYGVERERGADDRVEIVVRLGVCDGDHPREARQAYRERGDARAHLGKRDPREWPVALGTDHVHDVRRRGAVDPQHAVKQGTAFGRERGAGDGTGRAGGLEERDDLGADVAAERRVDLLEPRRRSRPLRRGVADAIRRCGAIEASRLRVDDGDLRGNGRVWPDRDGDGSLAGEECARVAGAGEVVGHNNERHRAAYYSKGLREVHGMWGYTLRVPYRDDGRSEEHTSELQSRPHLVCRLLLETKQHILNAPA